MTTQPEALRLADIVERNSMFNETAQEAAAELRRLHAENEKLKTQRDLLHKGAQDLTQTLQDRLDDVREQRDALLRALKAARPMLIAQIEAAIKKAEEA